MCRASLVDTDGLALQRVVLALRVHDAPCNSLLEFRSDVPQDGVGCCVDFGGDVYALIHLTSEVPGVRIGGADVVPHLAGYVAEGSCAIAPEHLLQKG